MTKQGYRSRLLKYKAYGKMPDRSLTLFDTALSGCGIAQKHSPHDCRYTFTSLLDSAGANEVCIDRLVGHALKSLTKRTYTHKDIEELCAAIELIKIEPQINSFRGGFFCH